jgi:hypothetical protein
MDTLLIDNGFWPGAFVGRFYFNLISQEQVILDRDGIEVPDKDWHQVITRIIEQIRSEEPDLFDVGANWSIEVVDEQGRRLAEFPL